MNVPSTVARSVSERGEVVLRRHQDGTLELRVNGVFVMDDRDTGSEELLATEALRTRPERLLVGGLGLGYTVRALLADPGVRQVLVAEIEPSLIEWMRAGLIPSVLDDERVEVRTGDVREVVSGQQDGSLDGILLDVDNGPDFLVYDGNAALYQRGFLTECHRVLRAGGVLTVWSSTESATLETELREVFGNTVAQPIGVREEQHPETYFVYTAVG